MSSPGAGKTSLILSSIQHLRHKLRLAVIEGDIASKIDADKIDKQGVPVVQINTGGSCSLEAHMIASALNKLPLDATDILFIENVGNLICPASFSLGEHKKVVISSITEGDDKPAKYPIMFSLADAVVINKVDLLPLQEFDLAGSDNVCTTTYIYPRLLLSPNDMHSSGFEADVNLSTLFNTDILG
jgi:hydrogenase nickel incorporation protein HypB